MAGSIKFATLGSFANVILGAGVSPTLKNLANGAAILSDVIDNSANKNILSLWELKVRGTSAFAEGAYIACYHILSVDGTNYADGIVAGPVIPPTAPDLIFPLRTVSTQQVIALHNQLLPNSKFKLLLVNTSGFAFTNTDNENVLSYRPYNYAVDV